jgi:hypothetical protein
MQVICLQFEIAGISIFSRGMGSYSKHKITMLSVTLKWKLSDAIDICICGHVTKSNGIWYHRLKALVFFVKLATRNCLAWGRDFGWLDRGTDDKVR